MSKLDQKWVREQFPSLKLKVNNQPAVYFDGPGGTQVPQRVIDAVSDYYLRSNANTAGMFDTSRRTDALITEARAAMADFLGCDAGEIVFGPSMTTLTFALARSIGRTLGPGDEVVVTTLDHDANVAPWRALEERGVIVRQVDILTQDCTLDMTDLRLKINSNTRVVAVGYAANAVGTINDVREAVRLAHSAGAVAFVDAVHYAPHGPIVRALDCDFLACSPYKFFGPHSGLLYGKREHLAKLRPYKVRPASENVPDRWETGTLCHEILAGIAAAVEYWAELGRRCDASAATRRAAILAAHRAIHAHEQELSRQMLRGLLAIPGLKLYGIAEEARLEQRVPTFGVRIGEQHPTELARKLGDRGFFTWDGNYYALNLTERLGIETQGGFLRIGLVHYNTAEEVERFLAELKAVAD